jgi:hypothetical protein
MIPSMLALVVWEDLGFTIFGWIDWVLWAADVLFTMLMMTSKSETINRW